MEYNPLLVVTNAILLVSTGVAFIMPLRRREKWWCWMIVCFVLLGANMVMGYHSQGLMIFVYYLITYLLLILMVNRATELPLLDGCYCAVWIFVCALAVEEIWLGIRFSLGEFREMDLRIGTGLAVFAAVMALVLSKTVARWVLQGDLYQVGPGQLLYGVALGGMFVALSYLYLLPTQQRTEERLLVLLCQVCCLSLLYLQTEVTKRRHAEKRLDILNLLCSFGAQQYAIAQQNVNAVSQKCEELDAMIRRMEQDLPEEFRWEADSAVRDAWRVCEAAVKTGNDVLDIVLTEKRMLAETRSTQINCVADGGLLNFMEVVDIYALFTYALELALEAVGELGDESHRLVDLLVCENQNFLVISMTHPVNAATYRRKNRLNMYKIMVVRRIVEKYHGMHAVQRQDGFFSLKLLIPLARNRK